MNRVWQKGDSRLGIALLTLSHAGSEFLTICGLVVLREFAL